MKFSKDRIIERLKQEGRLKEITTDIEDTMDNLDGQPVYSNSWGRQVYGKPVLSCKGKNGIILDVNENDCI